MSRILQVVFSRQLEGIGHHHSSLQPTVKMKQNQSPQNKPVPKTSGECFWRLKTNNKGSCLQSTGCLQQWRHLPAARGERQDRQTATHTPVFQLLEEAAPGPPGQPTQPTAPGVQGECAGGRGFGSDKGVALRGCPVDPPEPQQGPQLLPANLLRDTPRLQASFQRARPAAMAHITLRWQVRPQAM